MNYPPNVWSQLKNKTAQELVRALEKDGWAEDFSSGAVRAYRHPDRRRVTIHWHPTKTYHPKLLKALLDEIGWSEADLRRLKLIR